MSERPGYIRIGNIWHVDPDYDGPTMRERADAIRRSLIERATNPSEDAVIDANVPSELLEGEGENDDDDTGDGDDEGSEGEDSAADTEDEDLFGEDNESDNDEEG